MKTAMSLCLLSLGCSPLCRPGEVLVRLQSAETLAAVRFMVWVGDNQATAWDASEVPERRLALRLGGAYNQGQAVNLYGVALDSQDHPLAAGTVSFDLAESCTTVDLPLVGPGAVDVTHSHASLSRSVA